MPNTYTLISSNVLGSSAASVTFSAIPATYTDLVLRCSLRSDVASTLENVTIRYNSDSATNYSLTRLRGDGSAASSSASSSANEMTFFAAADGSTATSNTFSNWELYIPSYTVSQNKPMSSFQVQENNTTAANTTVVATLWRNTAAITSMLISAQSSNFVSGSSFYLYGIKNS